MLTPQTEQVIRGFVEGSREILGDDLAGVYLHGSAAMGCFHPEKSDIDLITVAERPLPDPVKRAYMDMTVRYSALGPAKGIEMSVVLRRVCKPFLYPTPYELHFSEGHRAWYRRDPDEYIRKMNGEDKDLAAHFTIINKRGICLYGAPIPEVFGEVPGRAYMDSLWYDISDAEEEIVRHPLYLTLNLARVLAYKEAGLVLSKQEGGEWAVRNLPAGYRPLLTAALDDYSGGPQIACDEALARRYARYMIARIRQ